MSIPAQPQIGYLVKQVQQQVRAHLDEALGRHGVTMASYAAMAALDEDPGLSNADLARRCFVTPQTMNRIVRDLEADGRVVRSPDPEHGRIRRTDLTPDGASLVAQCGREVEVVHDRMLADLSPREVATLQEMLQRCLRGLQGVA